VPSPISVIVPTYFRDPSHPDLRAGLDGFLGQFARQREDQFEVFIADSGPPATQGVVEDLLAQLLEDHRWLQDKLRYHYEPTDGPPLTRADAMNLGVQHTRGDCLLFLHVDCKLPDGGLALLRQAFDDGAMGGGFLKEYVDTEGLSPLLLTEQYLNWLRSRWGRHLVGTNGIFLHRELALEHPYRWAFLEDVELSDWLRERLDDEDWRLLPAAMAVSARKYHKLGVWPSLAVNLSVMTLFRLFALPPQPLKEGLYHHPFPKGWRFWPAWSRAVVGLLRQHRREVQRP